MAIKFGIGCLIFIILLEYITSFSPGDRVSTLCRTHHGGFKSPWMDLGLHQMPKFRHPESAIVQTSLPRPTEKDPEMKLNPSEDVKVSLVFAGSKLVIPMIVLYDSKHKKSLKSLVVTFFHDDFDIRKLKFETVYSAPIARLDPQHPSLTAFDLVYRWEAVHDNDLRMGVVTMFLSTLLLLVLMICFVTFTYDRDVTPVAKSDPRSQNKIKGAVGNVGGAGFSNNR